MKRTSEEIYGWKSDIKHLKKALRSCGISYKEVCGDVKILKKVAKVI